MPCRSDYLEPTKREQELRRAAKLLVYVSVATGVPVKKKVQKAAADIYGNGYDCVPELCKAVRKLSPKQKEKILYDGRNANARDLADWWEAHEKADRDREAAEKQRNHTKRLRKGALAKLSPAEINALRIPESVHDNRDLREDNDE